MIMTGPKWATMFNKRIDGKKCTLVDFFLLISWQMGRLFNRVTIRKLWERTVFWGMWLIGKVYDWIRKRRFDEKQRFCSWDEVEKKYVLCPCPYEHISRYDGMNSGSLYTYAYILYIYIHISVYACTWLLQIYGRRPFLLMQLFYILMLMIKRKIYQHHHIKPITDTPLSSVHDS